MRFFPLRSLVFSFLVAVGPAKAAVTFPGNGNTSSGGILGQGTLTLSDDLTNVVGTLTTGGGTFSGDFVLYIDSTTGGFSDTTTFGDGIGDLQKAISGFNGSSLRSALAFPGGFTADYAIGLGPNSAGFGGLWKLSSGGFGSLIFSNNVNLTMVNATNYTFSFPLASIGLAPGRSSFQLFGTYIDTSTGRSGEALPGNLVGANGWNGFAVSAVTNYNVVPLYHVVNTNDNGAGSLRQTISNAVANGFIDFATNLSGQTITLTSGELLITNNLTIDASMLASIIVDGGNSSRIFEVATNTTLGLNNLKLSRGNVGGVSTGGAIFVNTNSVLYATNCLFSGNHGINGGAIYGVSGTTGLMTNCTFADNAASSSGGAIYNLGAMAFANCLFSNNVATGLNGGAVYTGGSNTFTVSASTFVNNGGRGSSSGGAICVDNTVIFTATDCTFSGNASSVNAGALYANSSTTNTLTRCTFNSNTAVNAGAVRIMGMFSAVNSTFTGNVTTNANTGGAVTMTAGAAFFTNCTLVSNICVANGGAINMAGGTLALENCIVADTVSASQDIYKTGGTITHTGHNLISRNVTVTTEFPTGSPNASGDFVGTSAAPVATLLDPLGNNGGLTATMAPRFGSPAIDGGSATSSLTTDQRGLARLMGYAVDIGAVESTINLTNYNWLVTSTNDTIDFTDNVLTLREALSAAPPGQTITFDPALAGQSVILTNGQMLISKNVTLNANGLTSFTLDGSNTSRIFQVASNVTMQLNGLTLTRGNGGGATGSGTGGAMYNQGIVLATNCIFTNNFVSNFTGGAVQSTGTNSAFTAVVSTFVSNRAGGGGNGAGAIYADTATALKLTDCTLSGNSSPTTAGAIHVINNAVATINRCSFLGNLSYQGGAIRNNSGILVVLDSTFNGNIATNSASAIYLPGGTSYLTNCTIVGNSCTNLGGGIQISGGTLALENCIVADNSALSNQDIYKTGGTIVHTGHNLIGRNTTATSEFPAGMPNSSGDFVGTSAAPLSANLQALGNYGGLTLTMPPQTNSLTIEGGSTTTSLTVDQRGFPRLSGAYVDIGAVESAGGFTNVNWIVTVNNDSFDGALNNGLSLREAMVYAPAGTKITFDPSLSGQTIAVTNGALAVTKNLTVDASSLASLILDGLNASRLIEVPSNTSLTLNGLTLTRGNSVGTTANGNGGAIYAAGTLLATNCIFSNNVATTGAGAIYVAAAANATAAGCSFSSNSAPSGGALYNNNGFALVTNCVFTNNFTPANGAAAYATGSNSFFTAVGSTFVNNTSSGNNGGGGVYVGLATVALTNCLFSGNAAATGGGVYNNGGTLSIDTCTFTNNAATNLSGGGVYTGGSNTVTVTGSTFANNYAAAVSSGGAFYCANTTTLSASNCVFNGNHAYFGGGVMQVTATSKATLINCSLTGNYTSVSGGGFYNQGIIAITNCTLAGNYSSSSGAIYSVSNFTAVNCLFTNNMSTNGSGGTVNLGSNGVFTVLSSTFVNNRVVSGGQAGVVFADNYSALFATDCTFSGNTCPAAGGAIYVNTLATNTVARCTFNGNSSASGGTVRVLGTLNLVNSTLTGNLSSNNNTGAITITSGFATLTNCTIVSNITVSSSGGGIALTGGALALENCIVADNIAPTAGDIVKAGGTVTHTGHNLIGKNTTVTTEFPVGSPNASGDYVGTSAAPVASLLDPLGNNGGLTLTMAPRLGSLVIDGGSATSTLTNDQRGFSRLVGAAVDLGAVESSIDVTDYHTWVVTSTNDNINWSDNFITLREALIGAPVGMTVTFDPSLSGQKITLTNELLLNNSVTISATSLVNGLTISALTNRLITVTNTSASVSLINLMLVNGNGASATVLNGQGAAIFNRGIMALTGCTLATNNAGFGAIRQEGTMTMTNCTLANNYSTNEGGAYFGVAGSSVIMIHCTISSNNATTRGGGIRLTTGTATVSNSIVAGNAQGGNLGAAEANLVGTLAGGNNLISTTPLLYPLGNFGGPTLTMLPQPGSAAINGCINGTTLSTDQRGYARVVGTFADIGAVETGNFVSNINWVVTSTNDNIDGLSDITLREAFTFAPAGQAITFSPALTGQTILLTNGEFVATRNMTIDATGLSTIQLDGGNVTRIFEVSNGVSLGLNNLTLTRGNGAGLTASGTGGAIFNFGVVSATNCNFNNNISTNSNGGAIFSSGASAAFRAVTSTFTGNSSFSTSGGGGGAVYATSSSTLAATDCTFSGNFSTNTGGALYLTGSPVVTITRCTFNGNVAVAGAGLRLDNGILAVVNSTFNGNSATNSGSGIYVIGGTASLTNCTIAGNTCRNTGGGIGLAGGTLALENCIVADNSANGLLDIYKAGGTLTHTGHNLIGKNSSVLTEFPTGLPNASGDYVGGNATAILNPNLLALANNGGLTATMAPQSTSLAVDGGSATSPLTTDQRGFQRLYGARVDIGAVESLFASIPSNLTVQFGTNGVPQFSFTNYTGLTQTIITTTNIATPLTNWIVLGPAVESPAGSGKFYFSDSAATNAVQFYKVRTP